MNKHKQLLLNLAGSWNSKKSIRKSSYI